METDDKISTLEFPAVDLNQNISIKKRKLISIHVDINSKGKYNEKNPNLSPIKISRNRYVSNPNYIEMPVPIKRIEFFDKNISSYTTKDKNIIRKNPFFVRYLSEISKHKLSKNSHHLSNLSHSYILHARNISCGFYDNYTNNLEISTENLRNYNPEIKLMPLIIKTRNNNIHCSDFKASGSQKINLPISKNSCELQNLHKEIPHKIPSKFEKLKFYFANQARGANSLKNKSRLHMISKKRLYDEQNELRKKLLARHPVLKLLEQNINKPEIGKMLLDAKSRKNIMLNERLGNKIKEMACKVNRRNEGLSVSFG